MGKSQRDKGRRVEQEAANLLRQLFPHLADQIRRGWQARFGGKDEPDIVGLPFHVEVAGGKAPPIRAKMAQAIRDSRNAKVPVVMTKRDREEWLVTMRWEDWAKWASQMVPDPDSFARRFDLCLRAAEGDLL